MQVKARSRLKPLEPVQSTPVRKVSVPHTSTKNTLNPKYIQYAPLLVAGIVLSLLQVSLLTRISPTTIQNVLFPNSYLPFLAVLFLIFFFFASYILLNTRRGVTIAYLLTVLFFLRLQDISLDVTVLIFCIMVLVLSELAAKFHFRVPALPKPDLKKRRH